MSDIRFMFAALLVLLMLVSSGDRASSFECRPGEVLGPGRMGSATCTCKGQKDCDDLLGSEAGTVCKSNLECQSSTDTCTCPIGPAFNLHAAHDAFCQGYASKAVAAAKENVGLQCGNDGPRWSDNFNEHLDWCMSLGDEKGPPNTEASARDSALQSCREQIARRGEIANKPSVPIGDLTKPADPLDKLGVVKKPEGGVDQFLKKKP